MIFTGTAIYLTLKKKLSRAIGLLSKVRHSKYLLKTIYYFHIWYMLVKYGVKTKIIHYFKELQDYKKRLFVSSQEKKI